MEAERGIADLDTLKKVNGDLIETIEEVASLIDKSIKNSDQLLNKLKENENADAE